MGGGLVRRGETGQPGVSKNLGLEELEEFGEEIGTRCQKTEYTSILDGKFKCWIDPPCDRGPLIEGPHILIGQVMPRVLA